MSETTAPAMREPDGFSIATQTRQVNGRALDVRVATFSDAGRPRSVAVRQLDMGDQFDLAEVTGGKEGNDTWQNLAYVAASVESIDSAPVMLGASGYSKAGLQDTLRQLGPAGVRAATLALTRWNGDGAALGADAIKDAAKNSQGTSISAG